MPLLDGDLESSEKHSSRKVRPFSSQLLTAHLRGEPKTTSVRAPTCVPTCSLPFRLCSHPCCHLLTHCVHTPLPSAPHLCSWLQLAMPLAAARLPSWGASWAWSFSSPHCGSPCSLGCPGGLQPQEAVSEPGARHSLAERLKVLALASSGAPSHTKAYLLSCPLPCHPFCPPCHSRCPPPLGPPATFPSSSAHHLPPCWPVFHHQEPSVSPRLGAVQGQAGRRVYPVRTGAAMAREGAQGSLRELGGKADGAGGGLRKGPSPWGAVSSL